SFSSSSGVNTASGSFFKTPSSYGSKVSDANVSLPVYRRETPEQSCDSGILSPLPSDQFRFSTWHEVEGNDIRGTQLHCPRVRTGPQAEDLVCKENASSLRKGTQSRETQDQRLLENWENLNLSYQDLGDAYQLENFYKILRRLIRVEKLQLVDNSLTDLSCIRLPRCKELHLKRNHLTSFKQLPKIPQIQFLSLADNNIETLGGLHKLRTTPLESLTLKRNPCEFQDKYRSRWCATYFILQFKIKPKFSINSNQ
uniref:Uncharacterized protein n=1 Tax=Callorhinchus milii TaxID=7868 RepID=A0A4W3JR45_CALMI